MLGGKEGKGRKTKAKAKAKKKIAIYGRTGPKNETERAPASYAPAFYNRCPPQLLVAALRSRVSYSGGNQGE